MYKGIFLNKVWLLVIKCLKETFLLLETILILYRKYIWPFCILKLIYCYVISKTKTQSYINVALVTPDAQKMSRCYSHSPLSLKLSHDFQHALNRLPLWRCDSLDITLRCRNWGCRRAFTVCTRFTEVSGVVYLHHWISPDGYLKGRLTTGIEICQLQHKQLLFINFKIKDPACICDCTYKY